MKSKAKLFGLIAIIAVLFWSCGDSNKDGSPDEGGISGEVTYVAFQMGGSAYTTDATTSIKFIFSQSLRSADIAISDITVTNGTGSVTVGALSGSDSSRTLAVTTQTGGEITVAIDVEGIDDKPQTIRVFASGGKSFADVPAADVVADMRVGWNLGNSFDAYGSPAQGDTRSVTAMETLWGNPVTTQANIDTLRLNGFNVIRIPVSWAKAADISYNIRADWMTRVKQVVDYAVSNDMYIILNTHHDEDIFKFQNSNTTASVEAFKKIWGQIADAFKDYNEKLIFEGLNEPRTKGSDDEWRGGTSAERTNLNTHYQAFVDTVRASGGKNNTRLLMVNTYAASGEPAAITGLTIPTDTATNKIIVSYHAYAPYNFALNTGAGAVSTWSASKSDDTSAITSPMDRAKTAFIDKGIPVVIGEFGAMNRNNDSYRAAWAEYYVKQAKNRGILCVWWDNGVTSGDGERFGILNRRNNTFNTTIVNALMKGAGN